MARGFAKRVLATAAVITLALGTIGAGGHAVPTAKLPPANLESLQEIFDPLLAPLGLKISRAGLGQSTTYSDDAHSRHLSVYTEPTGEYTSADYVANFDDVTKVFLPMVFKRWKGLRSFDVCQEPLPSINDSEQPPPVTQIRVSRRGAKGVDWQDASLADLLVEEHERRADPAFEATDFAVYFDIATERVSAYQDAVAAAKRRIKQAKAAESSDD